MRIRVRNRAGQTLFLTFSVFKASLVVEGCQWQRVSIAFPASKGDACMKDTDHPIRHPRVHLGERASAQWSGSYARQNDQDGRGMAPRWAGATPLFATGSWPKEHWGRSSPISRTSGQSVSLHRPGFERSRRAGRTSSFLLVFLNNRARGEELFAPYFIGDFTNHSTGGVAPLLGKSIRYTVQRGPRRMQTGTMGGRERPHPLTHGASPVS
jgi:hypothetical protein